MKLALVTPYFPPNVGGVETYVYELARRLSRNNDVYVFTCGRGATETYGKVRVFRLRAIDVKDLPTTLKIPYPIPAAMTAKIAESDVDIVHAHGHAFFTSFQAALASRISHKPFILTIHDIGVAYLDHRIMRGVRPIVDSTLVSYLFKCSDVVIAQNRTTYNYSLDFNAKNIVNIPQGVDCQRFSPADEGEHVTFISARLVPQKGGEIFIRAAPIVLKAVKNAKFRIVGEGFQKPSLEKLIHQLGIESSVDFVGHVSYSEVPKYLSQANIVVFPSEMGAGLGALEAAAMKKAVVATNHPWTREGLGDAALYIAKPSPEETARAVIYLLENPDKRERIAQLGYDRVTSERSWDVVASRHEEVYDQISNRR